MNCNVQLEMKNLRERRKRGKRRHCHKNDGASNDGSVNNGSLYFCCSHCAVIYTVPSFMLSYFSYSAVALSLSLLPFIYTMH